jgi:DNA-binding NtrC family response regulator
MFAAALPHVLLVDDDLAVLRVLDRVLTRLGARVSVAADAETARSIVAGGDIDAAVVDYRLPGARGTTLLGDLVSLSPRLRRRTAFITGDIAGEAEAAIDATGCPSLMKPFTVAEFEALVRGLLAGETRGTTYRPTADSAIPIARTRISAPAA